MQKLVVLIVLTMLLTGCLTGQILLSSPNEPETNAKYLFYMHGIQLEELGADHKQVQDYEKILHSLASHGTEVISERRKPVVIESYARMISDQVNDLLSKGVPANNITVSGYSKGALITQAVSGLLQNPNINFILIAGCTDLYQIDPSIIQGRILSIYDKEDDQFYSCSKRINARGEGVTFKEVSIISGRGHRVFRLPEQKYLDLWVDALFAWIR